MLEEYAGNDLVAVGRLEDRPELELFFRELPGVVDEEPMEEVEQEGFKCRDELAEGEGGQVIARVLGAKRTRPSWSMRDPVARFSAETLCPPSTRSWNERQTIFECSKKSWTASSSRSARSAIARSSSVRCIGWAPSGGGVEQSLDLA
jgi:hypothetical protein